MTMGSERDPADLMAADGMHVTPSARAGMLRAGSGSPLILLHGVMGSSSMWRHVLPLLAPYHDVIAPTALGHRGGTPATLHPTRVQDLVDDAERCLDALGFDRVHLAGNSLGGWIALELARRKRAASVCALSPAGAWVGPHGPAAAHKLRRTVSLTRSSRFVLPLLAQSAHFRRWALRDNAERGERVSRSELLELVADLLGCEIGEDIFGTSEVLQPLTPDCPVTLVWSGKDRILPLRHHAERARELIPGARFMVLEGIGHVPMLDDPQLVADTILACTQAAQAPRAAAQPHAERS
jgi:pimeloyl-ACP methyl ester carboxylesterase